MSNRSLRKYFLLTPNVHYPYFLHFSPLNFFDIYSKNLKIAKTRCRKCRKCRLPPSPHISFSLDFGFCPNFCSEASHVQYCTHGPKTSLKSRDVSWALAFPSNSQLVIFSSKVIGLTRVLHAFWLKGGHFEVKDGHPDFLQLT